jgi:hypothetical protein
MMLMIALYTYTHAYCTKHTIAFFFVVCFLLFSCIFCLFVVVFFFFFLFCFVSNMCSNIPASPAYGVYISQLIRYARTSSNYSDFLKCHLHLRNRLLDQGYKNIRFIRSLKKFIFRYQDLVEIYSVIAEKIISDGFSYSENV